MQDDRLRQASDDLYTFPISGFRRLMCVEGPTTSSGLRVCRWLEQIPLRFADLAQRKEQLHPAVFTVYRFQVVRERVTEPFPLLVGVQKSVDWHFLHLPLMFAIIRIVGAE